MKSRSHSPFPIWTPAWNAWLKNEVTFATHRSNFDDLVNGASGDQNHCFLNAVST
jgi:hypothetical protein